VPTLYAVFYRAGPGGSAPARVTPLFARIGLPEMLRKRWHRQGRRR